MQALVKTSVSLACRFRLSSPLRVLLNIVISWQCPGFCAGVDEKSQSDCETICGQGRVKKTLPLDKV